MVNIFQFMAMKEIGLLSRSCRSFNRVLNAQNNLFWKARCHRDFPAAIAHVARDKDWFKLYKATAWIARQHRVARTYLSDETRLLKNEFLAKMAESLESHRVNPALERDQGGLQGLIKRYFGESEERRGLIEHGYLTTPYICDWLAISSTPTLADWIGCPEKLLRLLLEYGLVINLALPWLSPYLGSYYDWAADHWAEESCESCPPTAISYFLSLSTPYWIHGFEPKLDPHYALRLLIQYGADVAAWSFIEKLQMNYANLLERENELYVRLVPEVTPLDLVDDLIHPDAIDFVALACCAQTCPDLFDFIINAGGKPNLKKTYKGFTMLTYLLAPRAMICGGVNWANNKIYYPIVIEECNHVALTYMDPTPALIRLLELLLKLGAKNLPDNHRVTPKEWLRFRALHTSEVNGKSVILHHPLDEKLKSFMKRLPDSEEFLTKRPTGGLGRMAKLHHPKYFCKNCYCIYSWEEEICYRSCKTVFDQELHANRQEYTYYLHHPDLKKRQ